jgi:hypothetical protein
MPEAGNGIPLATIRDERGLQMRIQETDRILKESRYARNAAAQPHHDEGGMMSRAWRAVSSLPEKLTGFFKR